MIEFWAIHEIDFSTDIHNCLESMNALPVSIAMSLDGETNWRRISIHVQTVENVDQFTWPRALVNDTVAI